MPLRNQIPARLSARAVYSKQSAPKKSSDKGRGRSKKKSTSPMRRKPLAVAKTVRKKGRGRPKKPASPKKVKSNVQKASTTKTKKRKNSVSFKSTTEIIENHSSEADLSSEGEEEEGDQPNEGGLLEEVKQKRNDVEVSDNENKLEAEGERESSGEEGDIEEDFRGEMDVEGIDDEELLSTEKIEGQQDDSEDAFYSFPEPSNLSSTNIKIENSTEEEDAKGSDNSNNMKKNEDRISQVQLNENLVKKENDQSKPNSTKRKITQEIKEETEEVEQNEFNPKKKKKKSGKANLSMENEARSSISPVRVPSFSQQEHFNSIHSFPSFLSSVVSPNPHVDSMDSLIRLNKCVPCGNVAAEHAFRYLIGPTLLTDFFQNMYEKLPFFVKRGNRDYYRHLFDGNDLNIMLKEHNLEYKVHIDVVKYVNGKRIPIVADGRAYYSSVWEDYKNGFSVRIRNPQTYNKHLWKMCSLLQEYFSSTVGCNVYLTPPKAQGFPPHYDDIDAFIIQVEGIKYWKVYAPRYPQEDLARYSSKDFVPSEIGNPILQVCLNAGDMLYIPRGYIHQAATGADHHSLHLTFSANQLNTWGDLLLIAANKAVEKAILNDVAFRESISKDYMDYIGTSVANSKAFKRFEIVNKVKELAKEAMSYIDIDEAADLHSLKFIETALPPTFNKIEKEHSLHGNGSYWQNGQIMTKGEIEDRTEVQLIRKRTQRLVIGDNNPRLYHCHENLRDSRPGEEGPLTAYMEFEMDAVPAYLHLLQKHPDFVKVKNLPMPDQTDRINFVSSLYENGLIMTRKPLLHLSEESDWDTIPNILLPKKKEEGNNSNS